MDARRSPGRVAALFDVHGNMPALEAVLDEVDAEGVETIVFGGDVVPGPFPREVIAIIGGLGARGHAIRGNGEREVLEPSSGDDEWAGATRWVAAQLGTDELAVVEGWPVRLTLAIEGLGETLICHATPRSDEEIVTHLTPEDEVASVLAGVDERVIVCGHTHSQYDRRIGSKRLVNPGSVGMPYEREPGAYWALLGPDVELRRTPYDVEAAAQRVRGTGFPLAERLAADNILTVPSAEEAAAAFEAMRRTAHGAP